MELNGYLLRFQQQRVRALQRRQRVRALLQHRQVQQLVVVPVPQHRHQQRQHYKEIYENY